MNCPDYLVIGHITKDLLDGGFTVGGTVTYSGLTARNLGRRVGVVTSASPDLDLREALPGIEVVNVPSSATTAFQNNYHNGTRQQFIKAVAERITAEAIPPQWYHSPIVQLGPLVQELDEEVAHLFKGSLIGVTPQGWLRQWDDEGRVSPVVWAAPDKVLPFAKVLVLSEEDVGGDMALVQEYVELTEIVVVTAGWKGSTVYHRGQKRYFPAREVSEVDPTGAGDVYAAAYLVRLKETGDPWEAAHFANCVASFSVEKLGVTGIPSRARVEACLLTSYPMDI
ncbi:MAG: PfkB family carbohydrate kinase [Anaerolineae bacterium]|nr:PfkB family carbohydrate kinase [Anaerolineae bacterium]